MIRTATLSPQRETDAPDETAFPPEDAYQSVCKPALMTLALAIFSILALFSSSLIVFPLAGLVFAAFARRSFRRYPGELIGHRFMYIGGALNLALLVGSVGWHTYCYNTEVPDGYERIWFKNLIPEAETKTPYSLKAEELDGKRVFIKGYVRPGLNQVQLKDFILVGDFGQCCFGGNPKISDVIAVSFQNDLRVDYSLWLRHIGGVFRLNKVPKKTSEKDVPQVLYTIEADYLR